MKKLIFCTICIIFLMGCNSELPEDCDVKKYGLNGNVKSVRESCYWAKKTAFGEYIKGSQTSIARMVDTYERYFNKNGYIENVISSYELDDNDTHYCTYYDENNHIIKEEEKGINKSTKNQEIFSETYYFYDVKGRLIQSVAGESLANYSYQDGTDLCIQEDFYYERELTQRNIMKYDVNGFLTEKTVLYFKDGNSTLGSIEGFFYNEKGQIIKATIFDYYENFTEEEYYSYDESGRVIEVLCNDQYGQSLEKKRYDSNGNIVEEKYYRNGEYEQGYKYQYKLDGENNWIEKTILEDIDGDGAFVPDQIEVRQISYY